MSKTVRRKKTKESGLVVGILTMPHASGKSHIMRSYVEWLKLEGVTVVPVPYDTEDVELYFQVLHGLVIPGGDTVYVMRHEPAMLRTVGRFLELAMRDGEHFPVWAVCLGYEIVMALIGGFKTFEPIQDHMPRKLRWTAEGERSGMYKGLGKAVREETEQNHEFGVSPERFTKNIRLRRSFQILATASNEKGRRVQCRGTGKEVAYLWCHVPSRTTGEQEGICSGLLGRSSEVSASSGYCEGVFVGKDRSV